MIEASTETNHESRLRLSRWTSVCDWTAANYRDSLFAKEELIRVRPGLIFVAKVGYFRIVDGDRIIAIVDPGSFFEVPPGFGVACQSEAGRLAWLYRADLPRWPGLEKDILASITSLSLTLMIGRSISTQPLAREKLIAFLIFVFTGHGQDGLLPFNLTHENIAGFLGLTRVTVTRIVRELCKEGVIKQESRGVIRVDLSKLTNT